MPKDEKSEETRVVKPGLHHIIKNPPAKPDPPKK